MKIAKQKKVMAIVTIVPFSLCLHFSVPFPVNWVFSFVCGLILGGIILED